MKLSKTYRFDTTGRKKKEHINGEKRERFANVVGYNLSLFLINSANERKKGCDGNIGGRYMGNHRLLRCSISVSKRFTKKEKYNRSLGGGTTYLGRYTTYYIIYIIYYEYRTASSMLCYVKYPLTVATFRFRLKTANKHSILQSNMIEPWTPFFFNTYIYYIDIDSFSPPH